MVVHEEKKWWTWRCRDKKGGCVVKKRVAYGTKRLKPNYSKKQEASLISPSTPRPVTVHLPPAHHFHLCLAAPGTSVTTPVTTPLTTLSTTKKHRWPHISFFFLLQHARDSGCTHPLHGLEDSPIGDRHQGVQPPQGHRRSRRHRRGNRDAAAAQGLRGSSPRDHPSSILTTARD